MIFHFFLFASLLLAAVLFSFLPNVSCRPPGRVEQELELTAVEPMPSDKFVDYFEDFFPVLHNSSKLHENYHLEKKKYLTSVLGFPAKTRKMRR